MDAHPSKATGTLILLLAGYFSFVIYGSLVPLDYTEISRELAWQRFSQIPYLNLGIGSRADWVANILLFIPLAFLCLAVLPTIRHWLAKTAISITLLAGCFALSVAIEYTQLYFPPRTVSLNDIIAETLGAMLGIVLWWWKGQPIRQWIASWQYGDSARDDRKRLLHLYLFLLFGYNLLPLDLTLSPVEFFHKWQEGRILLIPFSASFNGLWETSYEIATDIAIWLPAAYLANRCYQLPKLQIGLRLLAAATLLEFLQLFVYSRVTDITDILTAGLGIVIGLQWSKNLSSDNKPIAPTSSQTIKAWGIATGWLVLSIVIFWYPYNFQGEREFLIERLDVLRAVPFASYYYGTEFRAVTEVLHRLALYLPLGYLIARAWARDNLLTRGITAIFITVAALVTEVGQLLLPSKSPNLTDVLLELFAGLAGYWLYQRLRHATDKPTHRTPTSTPPPAHRPNIPVAGSPFRSLMISYLTITLGLWLVSQLPMVPYNVRELFDTRFPIVSFALFAGFLLWTLAVPAWLGSKVVDWRSTHLVVALPVLLAHAIVAWILLRLSVPLESMHDIVGSPVLGWPWEWELLGRFIALYLTIIMGVLAGLLAGLSVYGKHTSQAIATWLILAVLLLPLLHWIIVTQAATDNLTELMDGGGHLLASLGLLLFIIIIAAAGSLAALINPKQRRSRNQRAIGMILLSPLLAYTCLTLGTEAHVVKYGQTFSALQFLFSPDREHYANTGTLITIYGLLHIIAVAAITAIQRPLLQPLVLRHGKENPGRFASSLRFER